MKKTKALLIAAALAIGGASAAPAWAHHSFPATYHVDQMVTITGEVVQFMFRNPHTFIQVMAKGADGKLQTYAVEWAGSANLARDRAVNSTTLKPGDKVTIQGNPGRVEEEHRIRLQKIMRVKDGWSWGGNFD
jgi:DNA/RNA endonuclease YhcR with UshA esterase domain